MIDNLSESFPGIVEDIVPSKISYLQIRQELKRLVEEGKSICNLIDSLNMGFKTHKKQIAGIEPVSPAWEAGVLPMNYICVYIIIAREQRDAIVK